jgi:hypothetical protein
MASSGPLAAALTACAKRPGGSGELAAPGAYAASERLEAEWLEAERFVAGLSATRCGARAARARTARAARPALCRASRRQQRPRQSRQQRPRDLAILAARAALRARAAAAPGATPHALADEQVAPSTRRSR